MKKRVFSLILCIAVCAVFVPHARAAELPFELDCKSAVLIEAETGTVICAKNENERLPEASITKVMTMLLVFEALDEGKISMDDTVTCSDYAASMGGSQIWLEPGEQMTVHDLIKAAMVGSANDASVALAEHVAGSHEAFVVMMNQRAAELCLNNTAYKNCTGLDAEGHVTSAMDIAVVSAELLRHEGVREFSQTWMDTLRGGELKLTNTNKLVRQYSGCIGLKTGTTSQAGCCLSAAAERDGMTLIAVVMGAPNSKTRFSAAKQLLDHGFASVELADLDQITVPCPDIAVSGGMLDSIPTKSAPAGKVLVKKGRAADIMYEVHAGETVAAPVEYGQTVGSVTYTLDGTELCSLPLVTAQEVEKITFGRVYREFFNKLK